MKKLIFLLFTLSSIQALGQFCVTPTAFSINTPSNSQVTATTITLSWTSASPITYYVVNYRVKGTSTWSGSVSSSTNSKTITNLQAAQEYEFKVTAYNVCDDITRTRESNDIETVTTDPPAIPTGTTTSNITQTTFDVSWTASAGAVDYRLEVRENTTVRYSTTLTQTSHTVNSVNITPGKTYTWRVMANGVKTSSSYSSDKTVVMVPPNPSGLAADNHTTTSFEASWSAATGATEYRLDVATNSSFTSILSTYNNKQVAGTSQTVSGLTPGQTYWFRVRAKNASGTSGNSSSKSTTTVPSPPTAVAAEEITQGSFKAKWEAAEGATAYRVDVSLDNFASIMQSYNDVPVTGTSLTVNGLNPGTTYQYRVRAINTSGTSANSGIIEVLTVPANPVLAQASNVTSTSFTISWSGSNATDYRVDVSDDEFASLLTGYDNLLVSATSLEVTGLSPGAQYWVRVRAQNESGISDYSEPYTTVTVAAEPQGLKTTDVTAVSFRAHWDVVTGASGYRFDVSADNFHSLLQGYNNLLVTDTFRTVDGLSSGVTYQFRVRATNGSGTSGNSQVLNVITIPSAPTTKPATEMTETSFVANWNPVVGADVYHLDVSVDDFNTLLPGFDDLEVTETSATVSELQPGTMYKFRVRAGNASGVSSNSDIRNGLTIPSAPEVGEAQSITSASFVATWYPTTSATAYRVDVSADNFSTLLSGYNDLLVTDTSVEVTGLTAGHAYAYRVRAVNGSGTSANAQPVVATLVPAAPILEEATNMSQTSFVANWEVSTGASKYLIDVSVDGFESFVPGYEGREVSELSCTVTGLTPGTTYQYRVAASNASGLSSPSSPKDVLTRPATPTVNAVPVNNPAIIGEDFFRVTWTSVPSATAYRIDVSTSENFDDFVEGYNNKALDASVNETVIEGLLPATTYYFRARAINSSGASASSSPVRVVTIPEVPAMKAATNVGQHSFVARWNEVSGATGYLIDVATNSSFTNYVPTYQNRNVSNTEQEVTGLSPGFVYYVRVRARNESGITANSETREQITIPAAVAANQITEFEKTSSRVMITWHAVAGASHYFVQAASDQQFNDIIQGYDGRLVDGVNELVIDGLQAETTYFVRISAANEAGESGYGGVKTITTSPQGGSGGGNGELQLGTPTFDPVFTPGAGITVALTGGIGSKSVTLYHRPVMGAQFESVSLNSSTNTYVVLVDESWMDELGFEFYFSAADASGKVITSAKHYMRPKVEDATIPIGAVGGQLKDYRIIAIPYEVQENAIDLIFEPALGAYDKSKWRFVRYQDGKNVDYTQGLSKQKMQRGRGYWFNSVSDANIPLPTASAPQNHQDNPFMLNLEAGWNQIGNPFPFVLDWNAVLDFNGNPETVTQLMVYDHDNVSLIESTTLKPFEGGFVFADAPITLIIPVMTKAGASAGRINADNVRNGWFVPLTVSQGEVRTEIAGFGMHVDALEGRDRFDLPAPPKFIRYVELTTNRGDLNMVRDIVDVRDRYAWHVTLDHNGDGPITIQWPRPSISGSLYLHDPVAHVVLDMQARNEYTMAGNARTLEIIYTDKPLFLETGEVELGVAYPNPATAYVTIPAAFVDGGSTCEGMLTVKDLTGKIVTTLSTGFHENGVQSMVWNLTDRDGRPVSSGLYYYELTVRHANREHRFVGRIIIK